MYGKSKQNLFLYQEFIEKREENEDGEVTFELEEGELKSARYSSIPHPVVRYLGFETSFVLYMLAGFWRFNAKKRDSFFLFNKGFVYTSMKAKREIGIEQRSFLACVKTLRNLNLISTKRGEGNRYIFSVNLDEVNKFERKCLKIYEQCKDESDE